MAGHAFFRDWERALGHPYVRMMLAIEARDATWMEQIFNWHEQSDQPKVSILHRTLNHLISSHHTQRHDLLPPNPQPHNFPANPPSTCLPPAQNPYYDDIPQQLNPSLTPFPRPNP